MPRRTCLAMDRRANRRAWSGAESSLPLAINCTAAGESNQGVLTHAPRVARVCLLPMLARSFNRALLDIQAPGLQRVELEPFNARQTAVTPRSYESSTKVLGRM